MAAKFCRYQLRTTDVPAARAFYAELFGPDFWTGEVSLSPLPERAAATGAPAHWVGHLGVGDAQAVEAIAAKMVAAGGQRLGPTQAGPPGSPAGTQIAVLRDPFGALVAASNETTEPARDRVPWHLLTAQDHAMAFGLYSDLFGWTAGQTLDLGPERGRHQRFSWDDSGREAGSLSNLVRLPEIHPQWLHFFPVADLDAAAAQVRARGGIALAAVTNERGHRFAPCDDPQGAAFGLCQLRAV
jgi:predicted enzyme related to lactoylglutathione lyase